MRKVLFVGNCQIEALAGLYQRFSPSAGDEQIDYLASYAAPAADEAARIAGADVIVEQRMDISPRLEVETGRRGVAYFPVPLLVGSFLWPFAGQQHPRNASTWFMEGGPYDAEMGDTFLNRKIHAGVPADDAAHAYLALDVNSLRDLDRYFELLLDRQRARDAACGFELAPIIEIHFRDEKLFRTPHHPDRRMALALACQLFGRMGMPYAAINTMCAQTRVTPFPKTELPVHPDVARHFGLRYGDAAATYQLRDEGRVTFAAFVADYLAYRWNPALAEGMRLAWNDPDLAIRKLTEGLRASPRSAEGWFCLADAARRSDRLPEAEAADRQAIALDPDDARFHGCLGKTLLLAGRFEDALESARRALALDPDTPEWRDLGGLIVTNAALAATTAAHNAAQSGDIAAAIVHASRAVTFEPDIAERRHLLGDLLLAAGDNAEAIAALAHAFLLDVDDPRVTLTYSRALLRGGHTAAAAAAAERVERLAPGTEGLREHLALLGARR